MGGGRRVVIGGAPMVLDRRQAAPLIGGAVCNRFIGNEQVLFVIARLGTSRGNLPLLVLRTPKVITAQPN